MAIKPEKKRTTEAELRALTEQGLNWVQISEKLGIHVVALRTTGGVLGIGSGCRKLSRTGIDPMDHVKALASGDTLEEIASAHGVTRQAIFNRLCNRGLPTTCRAAVKYMAAQQA